MPNLDSFTNIEAYSTQMNFPGMESDIYIPNLFDVGVSYTNHCEISSTKVLAVYSNNDTSKGILEVGDRPTDYVINWDAPVEFNNGKTKTITPIRLSDTKFLIAFINDSDNYGKCIVGTLSGTTVSLGSLSNFSAASSTLVGAILLDTDKVMLTYVVGGDLKAVIATISGTTVTYGTAVTVKASITLGSIVPPSGSQLAKLTTTSAVAVYRATATTYCQVLTVSGTTITTNTETTFGGGDSTTISPINNTTFVIAYTDASVTNYGTLQRGTISGTTITAGAKVVFDGTNYASRNCIVYPILNERFVLISNSSSEPTKVTVRFFDNTVTQIHTVSIMSNVSYNTFPDMHNAGNFLNFGFIKLTNNKANQYTVGYIATSSRKFMCGMFSTNNYSYIEPMRYKVLTVPSNSQVEISSIYVNALYNMQGYITLYVDGTLEQNIIYKPVSGDGNVGGTLASSSTTMVAKLSNNPIILTSNQTLYISANFISSYADKKNTVAVFGIKRS